MIPRSRYRHRGVSGLFILIATLAFGAWLQAHFIDAAVKDDGTNLRQALVVADDPQVRRAINTAVEHVVSLPGVPPQAAAMSGLIVNAPTLDGPVGEALISVLLDTRDQIVGQLDRKPVDGYHAVTVNVAPLIAASGAGDLVSQLTGALGSVDALKQLGSSGLDPAALAGLANGNLAIPVLEPSTITRVASVYRWQSFVSSWGLLIAIAAAVLGIGFSPRRLQAFGGVLLLAGIVSLTATYVHTWAQDQLISGRFGSWGVLVGPLLAGAADSMQPWLVPAGVAGVILGLGLLIIGTHRPRRSVARRYARA
jgi:hypothetical protein